MTEMVGEIRKGDFWKGEGQRVTIQQEVGAGKGRSHRASSQPFLFVFQTGNGGVTKSPQYFHVLSDQSSTHSLPQSWERAPLSTLWNPALGHGISTLLPAENIFLLLTAHQDWREEGEEVALRETWLQDPSRGGLRMFSHSNPLLLRWFQTYRKVKEGRNREAGVWMPFYKALWSGG
jgi:hypothetical protein